MSNNYNRQKNNLKVGNKVSLEGYEGLVYARVSSKRQEIEGTGLQSQEGRCIKELVSLGVPYARTFSDSFTGGGDFMKRPAMSDMLKYIDKNKHKKFIVVFDDLKRFARDVEFHLKLRAVFKVRNVLLKCLNYSFDETAEGRFVEVIFAAASELERNQNGRQVIQKQKARLESGYWPFGGKKGYKITKTSQHGKLAVPDVFEAPLLKEALEGYSTGRFIRKIDACTFLVNNGFWKNQIPARYIDKFTSLAKDSFYAGYIEYPAWEVERRRGHHEGIISLSTFELNQKKISKKSLASTQVRSDVSVDFPLRGLVVCSECGCHITAAWSKGSSKVYPYYLCSKTGCSMYRKSLKKEEIEDRFATLLKGQCLKREVEGLVQLIFERVWKEEVAKIQEEHDLIRNSIMELKDRITSLINMTIQAKTQVLRDAYESQIEEAQRELDAMGEFEIQDVELSVPYRTALATSVQMLRNPYEVWLRLELVEQHRFFNFIFFEKLPYSKKEGYRTDKLSCAVRLFEEFATANTLDVEMPEFESGCMEDPVTSLRNVSCFSPCHRWRGFRPSGYKVSKTPEG